MITMRPEKVPFGSSVQQRSIGRNGQMQLILSAPCAQVKWDYARLQETLGAVTRERDSALWERNQLRDKLENLEQVLKVRRVFSVRPPPSAVWLSASSPAASLCRLTRRLSVAFQRRVGRSDHQM